MNFHCGELSDLLPAYVVGALTDEEILRVQDLLNRCAEGRRQAAEYTRLMQGFYEHIDPVSPPPHLHQLIMSRLHKNINQAHELSDLTNQKLTATVQVDADSIKNR